MQADKAMAQSKLLIKQRELLQDSKRELLAKLQEDRWGWAGLVVMVGGAAG